MSKNQTPLDFPTFKQSCEDRGYTRISESLSNKSFVVYTKNDIKAEVWIKRYVFGYGRTEEELDILKDEIKLKGFHLLKDPPSKLWINAEIPKDKNILDGFWEIVEILENIEAIVARSRGIATRVFSREVAEEAIFEKIAKRYFFAIENRDQLMLDMARVMLSGDSIDHLIIRGRSVARTDNDTYREHVVPCIMIHNQAIKMVGSGAKITEVAQMIATNLAIVLISNEEQKLVDSRWRTTMPDGWDFGDNIYERLKQASIELK